MRHTDPLCIAREIDDKLLQLICCLARVSLADEELETATTHMLAVQTFLTSGASIDHTFQGRVIYWTDLRRATTLLVQPLLEHSDIPDNIQSHIPEYLLAETLLRTRWTLQALPRCIALNGVAEGVYQGLHAQSIAYSASSATMSKMEARWVTRDAPYYTVHTLSDLVDIGITSPFTAMYAILLATRIYAWTCVPGKVSQHC